MEDEGFVGVVGPFFRRGGGETLEFCFPTDTRHRNKAGVLQGGALATFADRALGTLAQAVTGKDIVSTVQLNMSFIDKVEIGELAFTAPKIVRARTSLVFMAATISASDRVVADVTGIMKASSLKPGPGQSRPLA